MVLVRQGLRVTSRVRRISPAYSGRGAARFWDLRTIFVEERPGAPEDGRTVAVNPAPPGTMSQGPCRCRPGPDPWLLPTRVGDQSPTVRPPDRGSPS